MRTIVVSAVVVAVALVVLGLVFRAMGWLIAVGAVALVVAAVAGWIGARRASTITSDDGT